MLVAKRTPRCRIVASDAVIGGGANAVSADGSVIVGSSWNALDQHEAFRRTATGIIKLGFLPGGVPDSSNAFGVSADGSVIVGKSVDGSVCCGQTEAFRWTEAEGMVGLGDLPGGALDSIAMDASADGSIIVGQGNGVDSTEAVIWDETNGIRELDQVLIGLGLDLTGWTLLRAVGISDDGLTIAGTGINPSGYNEGWIATIPEPSTSLLVATALAGLAAAWRRRRL